MDQVLYVFSFRGGERTETVLAYWQMERDESKTRTEGNNYSFRGILDVTRYLCGECGPTDSQVKPFQVGRRLGRKQHCKKRKVNLQCQCTFVTHLSQGLHRDYEIYRRGRTYTSETLRDGKKKYKQLGVELRSL